MLGWEANQTIGLKRLLQRFNETLQNLRHVPPPCILQSQVFDYLMVSGAADGLENLQVTTPHYASKVNSWMLYDGNIPCLLSSRSMSAW